MFSKILCPLVLAAAHLPASLAMVAQPAEDHPLARGLEALEFEWTGRIFKDDAGPTVFHGDAETILNKIKAINPDYDPDVVNPTDDDFNMDDLVIEADPTDENPLSVLKSRAAAADLLTCRVMATGNSREMSRAVSFLRGLGGSCGAPARDCRRMSCKDTTATYICSEKSSAASIACSNAANIVSIIQSSCCKGGNGRSGHVYHNRDWSIWAGYGNCGHSSASRPTSYPYPGGSPNGICYL